MMQINWTAAVATACFILGGVGSLATLIMAANEDRPWWLLLLIPAALLFGLAVGVVCGA